MVACISYSLHFLLYHWAHLVFMRHLQVKSDAVHHETFTISRENLYTIYSHDFTWWWTLVSATNCSIVCSRELIHFSRVYHYTICHMRNRWYKLRISSLSIYLYLSCAHSAHTLNGNYTLKFVFTEQWKNIVGGKGTFLVHIPFFEECGNSGFCKTKYLLILGAYQCTSLLTKPCWRKKRASNTLWLNIIQYSGVMKMLSFRRKLSFFG